MAATSCTLTLPAIKKKHSMRNKNFAYLLILFILNCNTQTKNSPNLEYRTELTHYLENQEDHFVNYKNYAENQLNIENEKTIQYFSSRKMNLKKTEEFTKLGFNILERLPLQNFTILGSSFYADIAIQGKVVKKLENIEDENSYYLILVKEVLADNQVLSNSKIIKVKVRNPKISSQRTFTMSLNENILLFINPTRFDKVKNLHHFSFNEKIHYLTSYVENTYDVVNKFSLDSKMDFSVYDKDLEQKEMISTIRSLMEANNFSDFVSDFL